MSATVVTTYARTPIDEILSVESVNGLSDADLKQRYGMIWAPGQLWERVAETPSNAPAPLTARQDAGIVRAYAEMIGGQGPLARQHNGAKLYSGIIRAGVRVK